MTAPAVGVSLGVAPPDELLVLLRVLARRVPVIDLYSGPTTAALLRTPFPVVRPRAPWAAWVDEPASLGDVQGARLVLTSSRAVRDRAIGLGMPARLAADNETRSDVRPIPPFVRERLRRARGLDSVVVVRRDGAVWSWGADGPAVPGELGDTVLALASAAIVPDAGSLRSALAWGCPAVTTPEAAAEVGAVDGRDCRCATEAGTRESVAAELVADVRQAAALSWSGRLLHEREHSLERATDELLAALRVPGRWAPSFAERRLDELDSRRDYDARARFAELIAPLGIALEEDTA